MPLKKIIFSKQAIGDNSVRNLLGVISRPVKCKITNIISHVIPKCANVMQKSSLAQ